MDFLFDAFRYLGIFILVIMVFNLMILVHEWGHYLAARWRGLKVEKFYIWFGKPIWKKTINGVEYGLGSIPAGGFVALPQMAPMGAIEGTTASDEPLPPISPLDKIIVAFAGPLFSFMLACFFAVIVWQIGKPEGEDYSTTEIGYVAKESPAAKAGLKSGDTILSIDNQPVHRFRGLVDSVQWLVIASQEEQIKFRINRPGEGEKEVLVKAELPPMDPIPWWQSFFTRPQLREVGITGRQTPMVASIMANSPAAEAGIQSNDLIKAVDGQTLRHPVQLGEYVEAHPEKGLELTVQRGEETLTIKATPRAPDKRPADYEKRMLGIVWDLQGKRNVNNHPLPSEQIKDAVRTMINTIAAITSPKSQVGASHLSGPVGIFRVYYTLFEDRYGWQLIMWFSVVLNVNLAIMNLLPFPVLDGGHIVMATLEWIRGKALNLRILEVVQTACVLLLFGFMIFVTMKDAGDWLGGGGKRSNPQDEIRFLPAAERGAVAPAN
jgi:regulator of sigma E protease